MQWSHILINSFYFVTYNSEIILNFEWKYVKNCFLVPFDIISRLSIVNVKNLNRYSIGNTYVGTVGTYISRIEINYNIPMFPDTTYTVMLFPQQ